MATSTCLLDRVAAWRHALSPWITCLDSRLSLSINLSLPDRDTIERRLWIKFTVPDQSQSVLVRASGYAERTWGEWLEALELLDLLARVDSAVCWTILHDLCDAAETLVRHGCPVDFFVGVQPRYEVCFTASCMPTNRVMALMLGVNRQATPSTTAFTETKSHLLAALPDQTNHGRQRHQHSQIRVRFHFAMPSRVYAASIGTTQYTATMCCLKRTLALAKGLAAVAKKKQTRTRLIVCAFGFTFLPLEEVAAAARDMLSQVAREIPIFHLAYGKADDLGRHFVGPFLVHLVAPHASPRSLLGVRKLAIGADAAHASEVVAMTSAIAQSRSLRELSFVDAYANRVWSPFLGFAIFSPHATHRIHTVQLNLHAASLAKMAQALTVANPVKYLAAVLDGFVVDGAYSSPPLTTVRVHAQAKTLQGLHSTATYVKTLAEGKGDVECYVVGHEYGEYVRVLAPGIGLCCVPRKDVRSETLAASTARPHPVRTLTLRVSGSFDTAAVATLLARIGAPLIELTLMNVGERIGEPVSLDVVLASCPNLKRLELSRVTLSLKTLVPTGWGHALESLTLRSCEIIHGRWASRVNVPTTMFPQLGSLYMDARDVSYPSPVAVFWLELAVARDLQRLVMLSGDPKHHRAYQSHVQTHHGERLCALPLRHKLALLSVVSAGGAGAKYRLNADVVTIILAMVAPAIRTRICTLLQ